MQKKGEYPIANKFRITIADITDTIPFTKPMERSIPPVMITKVSPAAKSNEGDELIKHCSGCYWQKNLFQQN